MREPPISIEVFCKKDLILQSRLATSSSLSLTITGANPHLRKAILSWIESYLQKHSTSLPHCFETAQLTPFQQTVLVQMGQIPFGETRSYKELAFMCKMEKGFQAIGGACHRNPFPLFYPCHRVISSDGSIGGFAMDLAVKKRLLDFETKLP